ncbi:hypothetical protein [Streptomyces botrytidirepellens]|uniref:hypothetical protein n=1 Tax=Streptomyces botrytidirepellens TaxID=2486417 RepID=UPI003CCC8198
MFYGEIFGWASGRDGCTAAYEDGEVIVREAAQPVAVLRGEPVEDRPDPRTDARWHAHFQMSDVDATTDLAQASGGTVAIAPTISRAVGRRPSAPPKAARLPPPPAETTPHPTVSPSPPRAPTHPASATQRDRTAARLPRPPKPLAETAQPEETAPAYVYLASGC